MFDIKAIRSDPETFDSGWAKRGLEPQARVIIELDEQRRSAIAKLQDAQTRRNEASKRIGQAKGHGDNAMAQKLIDEVAALKSQIQEGEDEERRLQSQLDGLLCSLPNLPADDVPFGADEDANQEIRQISQKRSFNFSPQEHTDIGEALGQLDFETAAKVSGSRFVYMYDKLAQMERALASFMLDIHTREFGYVEVVAPLIVNDDAMFGTGQLPKFADDQFHTEDGRWLIPTAEVPLTNIVRESILEPKDLPKRVTAWTPCFRLEAGAAGKDTRGIIRQHQFSKVELVSITTEDQSEKEHERLTSCAEEVLRRLGLHYRVVVLCAGDLGFGSRKTYDLEVWLPGQDRYREISSCSNFGDFQARRMSSRYRPEGEEGTRFVHTLNGSGLAIGRTIVAILENRQQADGSISLPECLVPYMGGLETITSE